MLGRMTRPALLLAALLLAGCATGRVSFDNVTPGAPVRVRAEAFRPDGAYPGACPSLSNELSVRPVLILIGSDDDWTNPAECEALAARQRAKGADVTIVVYPGAVHYFDVEGQPRVFLAEVENHNAAGGRCCGATVGFDASANADAHRRGG